MSDASADRFLKRPQGERAAALPDSGPDLARAERVVLCAADGNVLVKSVRRNADGTFTGEVYGVMPRQRSVAMGERVTFEEAQIFKFKSPAGAAPLQDPELADMERTFNALFAGAPRTPSMRTPAAPVEDIAFGEVELPEPASEASLRAAVVEEPEAVAPPPPQPAPPPPKEEMSLEDALAMLGADKASAEPAPVAAQPAPAIDAAATASGPAVENTVIQCMECGAPIVVRGEVEKVSCGRCGRINDPQRGRNP